MQNLGSTPLIDWTFKFCDAFNRKKGNVKFVLITNIDDAKDLANTYGCIDTSMFRPESLCGDECTVEDLLLYVLRHAGNHESAPKIVGVLQPTSPFRKLEDLQKCLELISDPKVDGVIGVSRPFQEPHDCVYGNEKGFSFVLQRPQTVRRQQFQDTFYINGAIYLAKSKKLLNGSSLSNPNFKLVEMSPLSGIDIDNPSDLDLARAVANGMDWNF